jgi:pimeloyl-ACP methyl ester carboxylesterase
VSTIATIRKGYVDTCDGQVHYQICEGGSRDPIVLIHMTASAANSYDALMGALAGQFTTIACDSPNYGQSFRTDREATIDYMAEVWLEAITALGVDRFHVLGHHTGASIGVEIAVQAPERVLSATLSGLVYTTPEENVVFAEKFIQPNPITNYGTQFIGAWTRVMTTMDGADLPSEFNHRETVGTLVAGEKWAWGYEAVFRYHPAEQLRKVTCPIFLATGLLDRYTIIFHDRIMGDRPDARTLTPEGRGVDYLDTYATEFAPHLTEFIDEVSTASPSLLTSNRAAQGPPYA